MKDCVFNYLGAIRYKYAPIPMKIILGSHTAIIGDIAPLTENEVDKVEKSIYSALSAIPTPKLMPMPPLTLRDDNETPINVIIKAASGMA